MAISKIIDGGGSLIIKKNDANFYFKVFKRKNGATIEFFWYTTDVNGNKLIRGGRKASVYSSLALAEAVIPANYSVYSGDSGGGSGGNGVTLTDVIQYSTGLTGDSNYQLEENLWYDYDSNTTWSQFNVSFVPGQNKIVLNVDERGFYQIPNVDGSFYFTLEFSPIKYTKAEIEAMDFTAMKGRDISIHAVFAAPDGRIHESKQQIVHFAGDANSPVPTWFKRPAGKRIASPAYFPNFSIPNRYNIINYGSLNSNLQDENHLYLTKGFNVVTKKGNPLVPTNKTMFSEYDNWASTHGCPVAHSQGDNFQSQAVQWLESKSMSELYGYYSGLISEANSYAVLFHDFEAFGFEILGHQDACNKIATLFKKFRESNPNTLITSAVGANILRIVYDKSITQSEMLAENNKYNLPFSSIARYWGTQPIEYLNINTEQGTGVHGLMSDVLGIVVVGDYDHRNKDSQFYSFIQECELAKIHIPSSTKVLSLNWSYVEVLGTQANADIVTIRRYFKKEDGFVYQADYKPATSMSQMFNKAMWSNWICDGQWTWHDPYTSMDGYKYHASNAKYKDAWKPNINNQPEYPYIKDFVAGQHQWAPGTSQQSGMEISSTIGYDYFQLALYILSLNNDILNSPSLRVDFSTDNGATYFTGEDLKPASAEFKHLPVVRVKKHPTKNEWGVLAVNKYLEGNQTQKIIVKIGDKTTEVKLNGQFSTFKRVVL